MKIVWAMEAHTKMEKKRKSNVKLMTKMIILFLTIIFVPTIAGVMVFLGFGYHENIDIIHELAARSKMRSNWPAI